MICLILHGSVTLRFSFSLSFFLSSFLLPFSHSSLFPLHSLSLSLFLFPLCFPFAFREAHTIPLSCQIVCSISLQVYSFSFFFIFIVDVGLSIGFYFIRAYNPKLCVVILNSQCVNTFGAHCSHKICYPDGISLKIPLCFFSCVVLVVCACVRAFEYGMWIMKRTSKTHTHIPHISHGHVSAGLFSLNKCGIEQQFNSDRSNEREKSNIR